MIEYIVFFGLLAAGLLAFAFYKPPPPVLDLITAERVKCESPIERRLYDALIFNGYNVKTQVPCGRYRIDLALPGHRIAIEADGKAYHSSASQKVHDRRKNEYLRQHGWTVLRFSGRQINGDMAKVLARIEREVKHSPDNFS